MKNKYTVTIEIEHDLPGENNDAETISLFLLECIRSTVAPDDGIAHLLALEELTVEGKGPNAGDRHSVALRDLWLEVDAEAPALRQTSWYAPEGLS